MVLSTIGFRHLNFLYQLLSKSLERLYANIVWQNKMHVCSWKKLYKPKEEGGLEFEELIM